MDKLNRIFTLEAVAVLITFSAILIIQAQISEALINATSAKLVTRTAGGNSTYIPPNQSSRAEARCDTNEIVTGGGGYAVSPQGTDSPQGAFLTESRPIGNGWQVSGVNPTFEGVDLYAYAVCAHLELAP